MKDGKVPSIEESLLGAPEAQKPQQIYLNPGGGKGANADNSSSVHLTKDSSIFEKHNKRHCSFSAPPIALAGSEAEYDP